MQVAGALHSTRRLKGQESLVEKKGLKLGLDKKCKQTKPNQGQALIKLAAEEKTKKHYAGAVSFHLLQQGYSLASFPFSSNLYKPLKNTVWVFT